MKGRNVIRQNTNREKAWKVMRAMLSFTIADVVITADVPYENIRHYVDCLLRAGYLKKEGRKHVPGRPGLDNIYRLVKNTGPKPPVQKALRFLYDPNTKEYWSENPELGALMVEPASNMDGLPVSPPIKGSLKKYVPLLCRREKKAISDGGDHVA